MNKNIIIIQDSREKQPCNLTFYKGCSSQIISGLPAGDYTALGYEDKIIVERKRSTGELSTNLGFKWKQFQNEMDKIKDYPYKYLVCEFPESYLYDFPRNSTIPKSKWKNLRMNSGFLVKRFKQLCDMYDIEPFFCLSKQEASEKIYTLIYDAVNTIK